jgi:hypothetical protein
VKATLRLWGVARRISARVGGVVEADRWARYPAGKIVVTVYGPVRYGAVAGPNHVVSASASPWVLPSPTHAT